MYRPLILPIYAPSLFAAITQHGGAVLFPLFVLELGYGPATAAFLTGLGGIGMLLFDIPAGAMAARFGDKRVMLLGIGAVTVSLAILTFGAGLWSLGAASVLWGMGFSTWMLGRHSFLTDNYPAHERGRVLAMLGGLIRMGLLAGPLVGGIVAKLLGYRVAFAVSAGLMLVSVALVTVFARDTRPLPSSTANILMRMRGIARSHRRILMSAGGSTVCLQVMRSARAILLPLTGALLGLDVARIGVLMSIGAAVDLALFYPAGIMMDRYGRKFTGVPCMVLFASSLLLLPTVQGFNSLLLVCCLMGLANGLGAGIVLTIGADFAPRARRAEFLGLWRLLGDCGHAGGPLLVGALANIATLTVAGPVVAAIGFAGAAVLLLAVEEPLHYRTRARTRRS